MPGSTYSSIFELAADQFGYVTAKQARELGVSAMALVMMERRGTLQRVSRGVYRLVQFPVDPEGQYMEASLWPATTTAVISHESALALYGISDVDPARIHITLPNGYRVRRPIPARLAVHHSDLPDEERTVFKGIPVTDVARTLRDCKAAMLGDEVIAQALMDAEREGLVDRAEGARLRAELELGPR